MMPKKPKSSSGSRVTAELAAWTLRRMLTSFGPT